MNTGIVDAVGDFMDRVEGGRATIKDLRRHFPYNSEASLLRALVVAQLGGRVHRIMLGTSLGRGKGRTPDVWGPVPEWMQDHRARAPREATRRPVSSVWELGRL